MTKSASFEALTPETLPARLGGLAVLTARLGADPGAWTVREVGDGNLNLVFIVEGPNGSAVVKQALPYVRLVGESWPLPLKRSFFEYHALTRQEARAGKGTVPEIYHFDEAQALIVMEYLSPHVILRRALIDGRELPRIGRRPFRRFPVLRTVDDHVAAGLRQMQHAGATDILVGAGNECGAFGGRHGRSTPGRERWVLGTLECGGSSLQCGTSRSPLE